MNPEIHTHHPVYAGGLLLLIAAPVHILVPQEVSIGLAAITLSLIGGAYIGFGAQANDLKTMVMELVVACLFGLAALTGLFWHWSAIPLGLAVHAIWDLLHHRPDFGAQVPQWYIPLCVVFDLSAALLLVILYAT
jgi:hypothetical protein